VSGRLPRTSREIALGVRTLRAAHARIGETIGVSAAGGQAHAMTIVGTTVFPTLSDGLDLGTGAQVTPGALHYLLPAAGAVPPADTRFVRYRPGITAPAGRRALAGRLARSGQRGQFAIDGPATPTDLLNFGQVQDLPQVLGAGLGAVALLTIGHLLITSVRRRQRDLAILRVLGFTSWQVRRTLVWQAVALAGLALVIGIPAGIFCGRVGWLIFAHQLGITPVVAVPSVELPVLAAAWLVAAAVIAALPGEAAARSHPARVLRSE
jgi:FtsX-like permease family